MFDPQYSITPYLLNNIKRIAILVSELNHRRFPDVILVELEKKANSLSAYASTSIEGNPLPLTEVKKLLKSKPENVRDSEKEVLNYNNALIELNENFDKQKTNFDLKLILHIHGMVMNGLIDKFRCGKLRQEPVFVNDPRSGKPVYLPPDHQDVAVLMNDLVKFVNINRGKIDALLLAGIFHKQFVIIHPFVDGNGRTARLLTKILLAGMGLDTFKLFSFENYYNKNVSRYFARVGTSGNYYELTDKTDFTAWLEYFTDGTIDELLRVNKELEKSTVTPDDQLQKHHKKILAHIDQHGFITDSDYARLVKRAKATRNLDFKKLLAMDIIERHGKGKNTYYKLKK